MNFKLSSDFAW